MLKAEHEDQPNMQGTFYTCICFLMHHVHHCCILRIDLGLEVEAFRESMSGCSSLEPRVRVDLTGRDCELEISEILLMVDPWDWGATARRHCIYMHGDIASSRVWVHGMVIHHSGWVWVEFVFKTTSNENS